MSETVNSPVVVGVDGSPGSDRAVEWAASAAALRHHPLLMVMAFHWPIGTYPVEPQAVLPDMSDIMERGRTALTEQVSAQRRAHPGLAVSGEFHEGSAAGILIDRSRHAAVTVVGQRGRGGFAGLLLGSVSAQVSAHARGPVVVVPASSRPVPASGPVVVGVDGSPVSESAVGFAFDEASWRGVGLTAVHAWTAPGSDVPNDRIALYYDLDEVADEEERMLAESLAGWREKYPDVPVRPVLAHGRSVEQLLEQAAEGQLLVVGSRGRGSISGALLGSVSRTVLHRAPCPVAVVRPSD